jgi:hypothetical protein
MAHLFVPGIEEKVLEPTQRAIAPGLQFLVEHLGGTADLRG